MPGPRGMNAIAVGAAGAGVLLVWSGLKGASVLETVQSLLQGQQPSGTRTRPIGTQIATTLTTGSKQLPTGGSPKAAAILKAAEERRGFTYCFGGGHGAICGGRCWDCSGYVSCVLYRAGALPGGRPLATGALARWGQAVPYVSRAPGDVIVWNGGSGGGHTGIIAAVDESGGTMWNNQCTGCGGVKLSRYPYGNRTAAAAVVRRAT
jgi:cell wall-associated NlpC family hydrolase